MEAKQQLRALLNELGGESALDTHALATVTKPQGKFTGTIRLL